MQHVETIEIVENIENIDMSEKPKTKTPIQCPTCDKTDTWQQDNPFRPFCSERCRLLDLGEWAKESYRIESDEKTDSEEDNSK